MAIQPFCLSQISVNSHENCHFTANNVCPDVNLLGFSVKHRDLLIENRCFLPTEAVDTIFSTFRLPADAAECPS